MNENEPRVGRNEQEDDDGGDKTERKKVGNCDQSAGLPPRRIRHWRTLLRLTGPPLLQRWVFLHERKGEETMSTEAHDSTSEAQFSESTKMRLL